MSLTFIEAARAARDHSCRATSPTLKRGRQSRRSRLEWLEHRQVLASGVVISEFMASNVSAHADDDGRFTDWIELHNTTAAPVNLTGYFLTDSEDNLDKWQFPNVSIAADGYMIVYASGLDRRDPAAALHANFKLESAGEYLALVAPDRTTIEHEYEPEYPEAYADVSYGIGPGVNRDALVDTGASGKLLVPTAAPLAGNWQTNGFDDSGWTSVTTGVGFEDATGRPTAGPIGYWTFDDTTADATGNNQPAALTGVGTGYAADIPAQIGAGKSLNLPGSGFPGQYASVLPLNVSETALSVSMWFKTSVQGRGLFTVAQGNLGVVAKDRELFLVGSDIGARLQAGQVPETIQSTGKNYADGAWHHVAYVYQAGTTTQRIYIDGAAQEVAVGTAQNSLVGGQDRIIIGYASPAANDWWQGQVDDVAIWSEAISPAAIAALYQGTSPLELASLDHDISTDVDGLMQGINSTAYLRIPFNVSSLAGIDSLALQMKYDDGFVAYLNGTEIARRNAPIAVAWNSPATGRHFNAFATKLESIDVTANLGALQLGPNVLAIQGLNVTAADEDFLLVPELAAIQNVSNLEQFYATPTPGAVNNASTVQFVADPQFSVTSSVIVSDTTITLSSPTPGASIYYTTNGSAPTQGSELYSGPIIVSNTTRIRARAFKLDLEPSRVVTEFYTRAAADVLGFSSNLPVIVIDTYGAAVLGNDDAPLTPVTTHFLKQDGARTTITGLQELAVRAGLSIRGQASAGLQKHQYTFETWDENNLDKAYSILGMPEESDWIIYGPYTEKAEISQALAYDLSNELGDYAVRTQYVEMFINTDGTLHYDPNNSTINDYAGLYIFMEKIKRDENRVDLEPMGPLNNAGSEVTGGYIFSKDKNDPDGSTCIDCVTSTQSGQFHIVEPRYVESTPAQRAYLENYIKQMEAALYGPNFTDPVVGYSAYIDPQSFVNNILMVELAKNIDGYRISTYYHKDRDGKVKMGPIWDYDLAFSNANYLTGWDPAGWYYNLLGAPDKPFVDRLLQDPNFAQLMIDSYAAYRDDQWSTERLLDKIDTHVSEIYEAAQRDHARWGRLGVYDWPNIYYGFGDPPHGTTANNHPARTYRDEVQVMRQWLHDRVLWMDSQFLAKPTFSQNGGNVAAGTQITIAGASGGTVYYTLNGSDPRLPGGGLNPAAIAYSGPITINANTKLTARLKNNTVTANLQDDWSAPTSAVFVVDAPDLILSEIMYDPAAPPAGSPYAPQDFEYVEVQNVGSTPLNLNGYKFTDGIQFTFPSVTLNPGQTRVVVRNTAAFATRYAGVTPIGQFEGLLSDDGETIVLQDNIGVTLFDGAYDAKWYPHTDEEGFSLVTTYASPGGGSLYNSGDPLSKWRASQLTGGNPGAVDTGAQLGSVLINEVSAAGSDWIELFNPTSGDIDIGGWYLSDSGSNLTKYQIPAPTIVPSGGYVVFTAGSHFGAAFGLSKNGETVRLSSPGTAGKAGGYRVDETFGAIDGSQTFGRYVKSTGRSDFSLLTFATLGGVNAPPVVGPVVISEIMYEPKGNVLWLPAQTGNAIKDEFIEIQNITAGPVDLFDPFHPGNTWGLTDGLKFSFPTGQTLAAGERALIVPIDPAAFRTKYSIPAAVKIYGPWVGTLDDGGEHIELSRPGQPDGEDVPEIRVDRVAYDDNLPWPDRADGEGPSLSRVDVSAYGNDPGNWRASHTGGTPGSANTFFDLTPPSKVQNVALSKTGVGTTDPRTNVTWTAASDGESGIASYNIYRTGSATVVAKAQAFEVGAATGLSFVDNTVFQGPAFFYQVAAVNGDGVEGPRSDLAAVLGRHVFYNNSKFDGNNVAANASDDAAIATDKVALLPGGTASFANYTSFNRGLNGIMVDLTNVGASLSASDFEFKVGNTDTPSAWAALPTAPTISVRAGAGANNSSRVTFVWPTGAATKQWLQVTVKANANTGLALPDVFYFGNAVGEAGNVAGDFSVSITDELLARNNPVGVNPGTTVINRFDYNRDGTVSVVDQLLARNNITTAATRLKQITVPVALQGSGLSAQGLSSGAGGQFAMQTADLTGTTMHGGFVTEPPKRSTEVSRTAVLDRAAVRAAFASERLPGAVRAIDVADELLELLSRR